MDAQNRLFLKNEFEYKNRLNVMNDNVYKHGQSQIDYLEKNKYANVPKDPFYVCLIICLICLYNLTLNYLTDKYMNSLD